ncbi:MAG: cupredoxin domain-containing protein [SAR324 cluster bacterium]
MNLTARRRTGATALAGALLLAGLTAPLPARAEEPREVVITFKDHKVIPDKLKLPAGKKFKFIVKNEDSAAEEFESVRLNREKVVPAGGQIVVLVGPLSPGVYDYFGDFHPETAQGELTVE